MKYDGLIFDLDGTLWSSAANVYNAIVKMKELHPEIRNFSLEDTKKTMGFTNKQTEEFYFSEFEPEKAQALCKEFLEKITEDIIFSGAEVYSDTYSTIKELSKKHRLFIVSNCGHGFVEAFLEQSNTEGFFEDYEYCARTGLVKGGNIKLIVERNKLKNPCYIGDTSIDKEAAEFAGTDFIYCAYGFGKIENDKKINKISELLDL